MALFLWMLIGHALADYPLQGEWIAKAKNPTIILVPDEVIWPGVMACHAGIHAGAVKLVTGSWILAGCEFVAHFVTDYSKCKGRFGYNVDQIIHVLCKIIWAAAAILLLSSSRGSNI